MSSKGFAVSSTEMISEKVHHGIKGRRNIVLPNKAGLCALRVDAMNCQAICEELTLSSTSS
jgi:hypothetical protein